MWVYSPLWGERLVCKKQLNRDNTPGLGSITIDDYDYDYDYMSFLFIDYDYDYDYSSL